MKNEGRRFVVCGDYNIAHRDIDVFDPKSCARTTGFFPQERAWFDDVIDRVGWVDAFRVVQRGARQFSWWSNFPAAWERNLGGASTTSWLRRTSRRRARGVDL